YKPYVVSKVISEDGSIVEEYEPTLVRQVISEETSKTVREILETVVSDGSGRTAAVPGYKIGGKTGTSEKLDKVSEEGEVENYVSSFLAVAPAYDPQIVVLLLLDEAQMENPYGSVVAAPVVGAMLADILPYMGIEPNYTEAELEAMTGKVKDVTGQLVHDAMTTLRIQGYSVTVVGEGTTVVAQSPEAKSLLDVGGTITLYTDESLIPKEIEVPDVKGMSVTEVNNAIIGAGLRLKLIGVSESATDQVAYSQTPAAGEKVMPGTIIEVSFTINTEEPEENG
ncbi:MAG: PASTA domain-containing protein, partial [Oscillospiraceae bacterium]|nr:PASTA domain-containing protein [Oscillospiraceae bacterium]